MPLSELSLPELLTGFPGVAWYKVGFPPLPQIEDPDTSPIAPSDGVAIVGIEDPSFVAPADGIVVSHHGGWPLPSILESNPRTAQGFRGIDKKLLLDPNSAPQIGTTYVQTPRFLIHTPSHDVKEIVHQALRTANAVYIPRLAIYASPIFGEQEAVALQMLELILNLDPEFLHPYEVMLILHGGMQLYPRLLERFDAFRDKTPNTSLYKRHRFWSLRDVGMNYEDFGRACHREEVAEFEKSLEPVTPVVGKEWDPETEIENGYAWITQEGIIGRIGVAYGRYHYLTFLPGKSHPNQLIVDGTEEIFTEAQARQAIYGITSPVRNHADYAMIIDVIISSLGKFTGHDEERNIYREFVNNLGTDFHNILFEVKGYASIDFTLTAILSNNPFPPYMGERQIRIFTHAARYQIIGAQTLLRTLAKHHDLRFFRIKGK